jgi:predicted DNA-binding protein
MSEREDLERLAEYYDTHDTSEMMAGGRVINEPAPEPMDVISVRLPGAVMDKARELAEERGVKVRELLREWIEAGVLESEDPDTSSVPVSVVRAAMAEHLLRQRERHAS